MQNTRVELFDGAILDMTPQGAWHLECVRAVSEAFIRGVRAGERGIGSPRSGWWTSANVECTLFDGPGELRACGVAIKVGSLFP